MKRSLFLMLISFICVASFGQKKTNPVLKIGKNISTLEEFEFVYNKNNQLSQTPLSPKEYLDLFVNYKLKVAEACALGYDTASSYIREFSFYRDELAKPYLTDKKAESKVLEEAYDHLKYEVDASHILIRIPNLATPDDTLKAYNRMMEIVNQIKKGESFESMAYLHSEDPSAKKNNGRLGYFTGFQMVYPFEAAAFTTPVDSISPIVRTSFGYHLIKVHDKRASSGEMLAAHIMKAFPYNSPEHIQALAKKSIDSIYTLIQKGQDFAQLAQSLSDDHNSAPDGGELMWFSYGRMIPEFANPAFALKENGQISEPIKTPFGWHIIKRIDHRGLAPFEEMKEDLQRRITNDERAYAGQTAVVAGLKKTYQYKPNTVGLDSLKSLMSQPGMTDSLFIAKGKQMSLPVCTFAGKTLSQAKFIDFLKTQPTFSITRGSLELDRQMNEFAKKELLNYEKDKLEAKYPDYRYLVSEYHDGLLIFEISQNEVWNKAATDTTGLEAFFKANQPNYPKPANWSGTIYYCKDQTTKEKLSQIATPAEITDSLLASSGILPTDVKTQKGSFFKGDNTYIDATFVNENQTQVILPEGYAAVYTIGNMNDPRLYELNEIRGQVLSDYQTYLEKKWIDQLKNKHRPKVYYKAIKNIKQAVPAAAK